MLPASVTRGHLVHCSIITTFPMYAVKRGPKIGWLLFSAGVSVREVRADQLGYLRHGYLQHGSFFLAWLKHCNARF